MRMNVIIRSACVAGLIGSLPCAAQTFGELRSPAEARSFAPGGLLADPAVSRWLMTLPSDTTLEPAATEPSVEAQLLDPAPIGGEVYHFAPGADAAVATATAAPLSTQLLAARPIGGEAYRITARAEPPQAVAENIAPEAARPALQGRSVAKRRVHRSHPARPGPVAGAHAGRDRLSSCQCGMRTGRSVAAPARHRQPESEGHADLPAPRGPAGLVTIVPF